MYTSLRRSREVSVRKLGRRFGEPYSVVNTWPLSSFVGYTEFVGGPEKLVASRYSREVNALRRRAGRAFSQRDTNARSRAAAAPRVRAVVDGGDHLRAHHGALDGA